MTPDMLMQPFEQSFTILPNECYSSSNMISQENYMLGYNNMPVDNLDFRPTFYNPFEIKHRRRTSRAQLKILEKSFSENPKPNATVRRILAQQLDMTPRGVQIWFQNRRAKAKLLRRKSTQKTEEKKSDKMNARSVATVAAASCMLDASKDNKEDYYYSDEKKSDEWFTLHPLAPVDSRNSDEWRRRSCPSLGPKTCKTEYLIFPSPEYSQASRRMTTTEDMYPAYTRNSYNDYPQWNTTDFFQTLNYSPISQQMTPKLSTGSPISIEGGYYDSCLDLILSSSSSPAPML